MSQLPQPPNPLEQRTREPREADLRYRAFFDNTSEGIYRIDFTSPIPITLPDDELIDQLRRHAVLGEVNEAMSKMYGLTPGEIVGQPATTFAPNYGKRQLMAIRAPGHRVFDVATVDVDKDGQPVHLLETFTCIVEHGHLVHIWGLQRDITARWRAERAMEKRLEALTQPLTDDGSIAFEDLFNLADIQRLQDEFARATGVASIITGTDGTPITAPSGFCRLCKDIIRETPEGRANCYRSDALLGRARPEGPVVQPCTSGGLWDAGAGISVGGRHLANWLIGQVRDETQTEDRMRAYAREIGANEHEVIAAFREVPGMSREQFGHVAQVLFTLANQLSTAAYQNIQQARFITERRRAEQEQRQLQGQLAQAQKMESIGRLAGGVAHDFNNMLAVILGHTELALDRLVSTDPLHADLMEIRKAAERSADLVRQLLAFARKQTVSPRVLDLNAVVDGMLKMLRRLIGEDVNLTWRPGTDLRPVKIDPSQLDQVLTNLCVNARDSIDGVGTITIETRNGDIDEAFCATHPGAVPGGYVTLDVADTGCGMSRDAT